MKKHSSRRARKPYIIIALLVITVVLIGGTLWLHDHNKPQYKATAKTTSTAKSAQSDFEGDSQKTIPASTPDPDATATDESSNATLPTTSASQWSKSKDGTSIIVYSPTPNNLFTSGDTVTGTATSSSVSYRLTDSVSGNLTNGTASVVNGKFSIKFTFATSASTGNVEVFNQENSFSPETNNVLIPVRFK